MTTDRNGNPLPTAQGGDDPGVMRGLAIGAARDEAMAELKRRGAVGPDYIEMLLARPKTGASR